VRHAATDGLGRGALGWGIVTRGVASEPLIVFHILGPIEISVDGRSIPLPGGYARSILGLLLLHPNRVLSPDDLIDALWRDNPPRTAPNVLQAHVVSLRRALRAGGEGLITRLETQPSGYRLRIEPQELDSELFEAEVADAERLAPSDPGTAVDDLRRALARWRGTVEAGGTDSSVAAGVITRLEELRLGASETLAELNLRLGRARDVASDLEPLAREHPFRERFHALLMIALYRTGRQAEALVAYRSARDALVGELGVEPGPELRALELAVLRQEPGLMGTVPRVPAALDAGPVAGSSNAEEASIHAMPSIDTSFVGRQGELTSVVDLLAVERLITITGVGGAGKTRFAIQAAALALERFPGGAWFVDLTPVPDGERMELAVAAGLGIAEQAGRGILETVIEGLGDSRRLLILDNCEHVVEACARFAEALLEGAPALSILATSREPLRLSSEVLWRLAPLDLPAAPNLDGGDPATSDAVRLLLDRAGRVRPGRAWTDADLDAMAQICHRLDGLPLAIEMAAARLRVLEPQDVLDRLDDRFRLLTDGGRTAIPRHRTLRATLDWSYDLLDEGDQTILRRMSAFATAVPPAAVEAICGGPDVDAVEAVVRLADRSLAITTVGSDGRSRFGLLDTVREYGRVQLRASGEEQAIAQRHLTYWTEFATRAFEQRIDERDQQADALEREVGELRLALDRGHAVDDGSELALAGRLGWFWAHHTHLTEGRRLLDRALSGSAGDELDRARCLCATGALAAMQGEAEHAFEAFEAGLAILRRRGETVEECTALDDLGWGRFFLGDNDGAEAAFERAVGLADQAAIPGLIRRTNAGLCQVLVAKGDVGRARALAEQLVRIAGGDLWTSHLAHHFLADCALIAGDPTKAREPYRMALQLAHRMGNALETAIELQGVAMAAAGSGELELGIRLSAAAEATFTSIGFVVDVQFWIALVERYLGPARQALGERTNAIDRAGRALALEDAVREGLEGSASPTGAA
jgi:predicted ATPase/DNA-binding SARP family transcriptional activator